MISLLISILIFTSSSFSSLGSDSGTGNFIKYQSNTILNRAIDSLDTIFSKKRPIGTNIISSDHLVDIPKKKKMIDNSYFFERIYAKWGKRPAELNCAWAPKIPKDRRRDPNKLRIMSYNSEWLFLYGGSGSIQCPGLGCPWKDLASAKNHIMQTISLLTRIDPDIVHLNEVEDCRVLRVIMDLLPKNHGYRAYLISGTDSMTGQNVGILTRIDPISDLQRTEIRKTYPISGSTCGSKPSCVFYSRRKKCSGTMGLSKHYLTHFKIGEFKILWAGAHFIAHPNNVDRCFRREAQATVLSEFIEAQLSDDETEIIITGDFNDHDDEVLGANNTPPLSSTLRILKNGKTQLHSAASFVSEPYKRYTSWHDINGNCVDDGPQEHSLIDHVLLSPGLQSKVVSVWMDHNNTIACHDRTSDHWPLIIDFSI